jgi:ABC-type transport system involved in cytochrome c biogenesis ATPase subunit
VTLVKMAHWYSRGICPLDALARDGWVSLSFAEEDGVASDRVLLTGISGAGKSTLLALLAGAWAAARAMLGGASPVLPPVETALVITGLSQRPVLCLCAGDEGFWRRAATAHPQALAVGWLAGQPRGWDAPQVRALARRAGEGGVGIPNALLLDDAQDPTLPPGALAQEMEDLAAQAPERCAALLTLLEPLLSGKCVVVAKEGAAVRMASGALHALDKLSAGEKRVLGMLLAVCRQFIPGGVLLVDEPAAHLHPSQVLGLLATLERMALPGGGQIILTSHAPEVWRRYDRLGVNLALEGAQA